VGEDAKNTGQAKTRTVRTRPHWWVVLAVSLSLLALVAARTSDHKVTLADGRGTQPVPPGRQPKNPRSTAVSPPSTSTSGPGATTQPVAPSSSAPVTAQTVLPSVHVLARQSAPTTTTTSTTGPVSPTVSGSTIDPAPAQQAESAIYTGYLQQPYDPSASYPFTGSGSMQVSATWPTVSTVSLTVTCPAGSQTGEGSSTVAVVIPNADGACVVTLKETEVEYDAVSYTLTISPTDGG
jgi:hypothetical protein